MQSLSAKRPFSKNTQAIYFVLATFNVVGTVTTVYLTHAMGSADRDHRKANERMTRAFVPLGMLENAAGEVRAAADDAFFSKDSAGLERARLRAAASSFKETIPLMRLEANGDRRILAEVSRLDELMTAMVHQSHAVFRFVEAGDTSSAAAALSALDQSDGEFLRYSRTVRALLRERQTGQFHEQSLRSAELADQQRWSIGFMAILVIALVAYGRRLSREVTGSHIREEEFRQANAELDAQGGELIHKQQLLTEAQRMARLGAWEWDIANNRGWWSDELYCLLGLAPGSVAPSYTSYMERVHRKDSARVAEAFSRGLSERARFDQAEYTIVLPSGEKRIHRTVGGAEVDEEGKLTRVFGVAQDVTEEKRAEEQLMRKESQLAEAQRIARIGSWTWEIATDRAYWSDQLFSILGYEKGEVVPCLESYVSLIPDGERARVIDFVGRALLDEVSFTFEHVVVRHDGAEATLHVEGIVERESGSAVRMCGVVQDVTERRRAELSQRQSDERLQLVSRATNVLIWDWNVTTAELWVHDNHVAQFGRTEEATQGLSEFLGRIHPDDVDRVHFSLGQALEGDGYDWTSEYRFRDIEGRWHDVLDRALIMRDDAGNAIRMIGAVIDISERRAVERMKDEFISTVSHELRTPLTAIRGALGLLASGRLGTLPEKGQRLLHVASTNTDRLVRLINDILDIERIESGKVTIAKEHCDAAEVARHAVDIVRPLADSESITITLDAESIPLLADPDRLIQTLTNLLGNAVKFSPARSVISLTVECEGLNVAFRVADQGRGIPAGNLATIFERFQQVDASDSRDKGGSGLGLAISRSIARQHGGDIGVQSELDHGSTFTVTIPTGIDDKEGAFRNVA